MAKDEFSFSRKPVRKSNQKVNTLSEVRRGQQKQERNNFDFNEEDFNNKNNNNNNQNVNSSEYENDEEQLQEGSPSLLDLLGSNEDQEDDSERALNLLLSTKDILLKTDVPAKAIPSLSRALTLGVKYKSTYMINYLENYFQLRISKDRQGRSELVGLFQRRQERSEMDDF